MIFAHRLQAMGYVGHFDLDTVVNDDGRVYLLEINPRRTGGTHVHEFAEHVFGADYLDKVTLLSNDTLSSGGITDLTNCSPSSASSSIRSTTSGAASSSP